MLSEPYPFTRHVAGATTYMELLEQKQTRDMHCCTRGSLRESHLLVAHPDQAISDHPTRKVLPVPELRQPEILLFYAEEDLLITLHHAHRLVAAARTAGRSIQAYFTPCAIHCGSYGHDPQRYMSLVQQFVAL